MDHRSPSGFDRLAPASSRYASLPVGEAFTWAEVAAAVPPGEWYMVAFRSTRLPDADEAALREHDDLAHAEAMSAIGFVHYLKGPTTDGGRCLSFCLWDSRAEARAAAGRPAHAAAAALTHEAYAAYSLEFHRVTRLADDARFTFEYYDRREIETADPPPHSVVPDFAPGAASA
jgi:hypothetical protein